MYKHMLCKELFCGFVTMWFFVLCGEELCVSQVLALNDHIRDEETC